MVDQQNMEAQLEEGPNMDGLPEQRPDHLPGQDDKALRLCKISDTYGEITSTLNGVEKILIWLSCLLSAIQQKVLFPIGFTESTEQGWQCWNYRTYHPRPVCLGTTQHGMVRLGIWGSGYSI